MSDENQLPDFDSYEQMAEFWDPHSLADYWEQTEPAEFELDPNARHRYLAAILQSDDAHSYLKDAPIVQSLIGILPANASIEDYRRSLEKKYGAFGTVGDARESMGSDEGECTGWTGN